MEIKENRCVCDLKPGVEATILYCPNPSCLEALGIRPGKKIRVELKHPFGGPFLVSVNNRKIAIDPEIAKEIRV